MNKQTKRVIGVAALSVVTLSLVGGTLAKYTSESVGTAATARVAKFAPGITGNTDTTAFTTLWEDWGTLGKPSYNATDGTITIRPKDDEADVWSLKDPRDNVLAPGTSGVFNYEVNNANSEVTVDYTINFTVANDSSIPVEYSYTEGFETNGDPKMSEWSSTLPTQLTGQLTKDKPKDHVKVFWRWAYERGADDTAKATNDSNDTNLGKLGEDTISVKADATFTQSN